MTTINDNNLKLIKKLYSEGLSVREVSESINAPLNATFYFFRKHKIIRRSAQDSNSLRFEKKPLSFRIKNNLSNEEEKLKIAGLMLYWGEGSKRGKSVDLANSDSTMIKIFLRFLREICVIEEKRLRVYTYCYSNQDLNCLLNYWSKITKIPLSQFSKPYVRNDYKMVAGRQMEYGMIHIRYSDKKLLNYLLKEINKYQQDFS
jgi:hypothetical protein